MPNYPWLYENKLDTSLTVQKMTVLAKLGTPYSESDLDPEKVERRLKQDAERLAARIKTDLGEEVPSDTEVIALIAYMQKLGKDIKWRD